MSHSSPVAVTYDLYDEQRHIYSSYYVCGMIIWLFTIFLLYQQRSPLNLCFVHEIQCINRYFNAASFFLLRGLSYITAGLVSQYCPSGTSQYHVLWSFSIIFHDVSLLYLIIFIGPICVLSGWDSWTLCQSFKELKFGDTPMVTLTTTAIAICCVFIVTVYDLTATTKYSGTVLESMIMIYFMLYLIVDGCYRFNGQYLKTIWLYIEYIVITWAGFLSLHMFLFDEKFYTNNKLNFTMVYNIMNLIAQCILFAGIVYENKVYNELEKAQQIEDRNAFLWSGTAQSADYEFSDSGASGNGTDQSGAMARYGSDIEEMPDLEHLDFASHEINYLDED
mmetsp:Transcript_73353/g.116908  ORF Transcript_73353/g.116908 Transcript_73353/m.116908 type:complete len:335 (+) Transcript_73353:29-1033(+)|eukprot:CAMPEP_0197033868 /NCGR_PEP_ID=MMETSP1384-20130603/12157_1 /TAXON_ID=29189 /ORGANISM="Ammonia sp." /LENGTH=334 /DNA_ID=CAMNT_0042463731 /DNA_START=29 /DNA_END=1033 /DNA_ORIENTATION=-